MVPPILQARTEARGKAADPRFQLRFVAKLSFTLSYPICLEFCHCILALWCPCYLVFQ